MARDEHKFYTKEELHDMNRLEVRRIAKELDLDVQECAEMDFDDVVEWLYAKQEGAGEDGGSSKKGKSRSSTKGKDKTETKAKSRKEEEKKPPKSSRSGGDIEDRVDTLGKTVDDGFADLKEELAELRSSIEDAINNVLSENYKILRNLIHLGTWLEEDNVMRAKVAPEGLGFEELQEKIETEINEGDSGEDEGDE